MATKRVGSKTNKFALEMCKKSNVHIMLNIVRLLDIKCHNATKKCHNVTEKCHAMTSCGYENIRKTQGQSVGYVKVRFFALPLNVFAVHHYNPSHVQKTSL